MTGAGKTIKTIQANDKMKDLIGNAITIGAETLAAAGVAAPRMEAGSLMTHVMQCDRAFLIAHSNDPLSDQQLSNFRQLIGRRAAREPLQYITGHQEFFKLDFQVTPDVLIPRPETELIVEVVLDLFPTDAQINFVDVGTGSGCIAISILHERQLARATAIDLSAAALAVAKQNAERHHVIDRMRLLRSNLFADVDEGEVFDLIVSNPPYIRDEDISELSVEVQQEPRPALAGGADGLNVIAELLDSAPLRLSRGGYLTFEFGINQDRAIKRMVNTDLWELIEVRSDLQSIPRIIVLRKL